MTKRRLADETDDIGTLERNSAISLDRLLHLHRQGRRRNMIQYLKDSQIPLSLTRVFGSDKMLETVAGAADPTGDVVIGNGFNTRAEDTTRTAMVARNGPQMIPMSNENIGKISTPAMVAQNAIFLAGLIPHFQMQNTGVTITQPIATTNPIAPNSRLEFNIPVTAEQVIDLSSFGCRLQLQARVTFPEIPTRNDIVAMSLHPGGWCGSLFNEVQIQIQGQTIPLQLNNMYEWQCALNGKSRTFTRGDKHTKETAFRNTNARFGGNMCATGQQPFWFGGVGLEGMMFTEQLARTMTLNWIVDFPIETQFTGIPVACMSNTNIKIVLMTRAGPIGEPRFMCGSSQMAFIEAGSFQMQNIWVTYQLHNLGPNYIENMDMAKVLAPVNVNIPFRTLYNVALPGAVPQIDYSANATTPAAVFAQMVRTQPLMVSNQVTVPPMITAFLWIPNANLMWPAILTAYVFNDQRYGTRTKDLIFPIDKMIGNAVNESPLMRALEHLKENVAMAIGLDTARQGTLVLSERDVLTGMASGAEMRLSNVSTVQGAGLNNARILNEFADLAGRPQALQMNNGPTWAGLNWTGSIKYEFVIVPIPSTFAAFPIPYGGVGREGAINTAGAQLIVAHEGFGVASISSSGKEMNVSFIQNFSQPLTRN